MYLLMNFKQFDLLFDFQTLVLDHQRFMALKDRRQRITLISAVMLVTFNTVGPSISGISEFKAKLKDNISIILHDVAPR